MTVLQHIQLAVAVRIRMCPQVAATSSGMAASATCKMVADLQDTSQIRVNRSDSLAWLYFLDVG